MLKTIAEYRLLTATQAATLFQKNKKTMWKRLHDFEVEGLVASKKYGFGRGKGRPELIFSLTEHGTKALKENGVINPEVLFEKISAENIHCIDHQLMLNWFRIHLHHTLINLPRMSGTVLSHNSPFLSHTSKGQSLITNYAPVEATEDKIKFIPDAAFALHDAVQAMTCMFFLEVDCGTETVASLCLSLFPWARYRKRKGAIKLHTLLDLRGNIPSFIRITDGKVHDASILDEIVPDAVPSISWTGLISISIVYILSQKTWRFLSSAERGISSTAGVTITRSISLRDYEATKRSSSKTR